MDKRTLLFVILMTATFFLINHFVFPPKQNPETVALETAQVAPAPPPRRNETLYVIENSYQQLVISSLGGALAEINLPLKSKDDPLSVVRPITTDKQLTQYFPSNSYTTYEGTFSRGSLGGYYPLLRRNLSPAYYALATATGNPESAETTYKVRRLEKHLIELEGESGGVSIRKIYALPEEPCESPYTFSFTVTTGSSPADLGLSTGIPEVEIVSGSSSPSLKYLMKTHQKKNTVEQISLPKKGIWTLPLLHPEWIANSNGFFSILIDPLTSMGAGCSAVQIPAAYAPSRLPQDYPGYNLTLPFASKPGTYEFRVYAGPLDSTILEKNDAAFGADYSGMRSFHGFLSFISEPFAKFLFFLMKIFYAAVHSWGISIILLTIALRIMMYPLNAWSIKSTLKMQKLSPKLAALQERYKKDPKKAQLEMMALYKEHGVNPLGGCFPLLIQMPFLIGMFDLLKSTFELRGVSFIPGWITNLTAPDVLFAWSTSVPFFGTSFHLLPFILGGVMFWQQRMSGGFPKNPKAMTDQQKQQKLMGNIMVIVFTLLFYNFPSGLNLYWLSSMLLAILQQWWTTGGFRRLLAKVQA